VQLSSELIVDEVHEVTLTSEETLSQVTSYSFQSTEGECVEINVGFKEGRTLAELRRRYNKCPRTFMFIPVTTSNWSTIQDGSSARR